MKTVEELAVEKILERMVALARYCEGNEEHRKAVLAQIFESRKADRALAMAEQHIGISIVYTESVSP